MVGKFGRGGEKKESSNLKLKRLGQISFSHQKRQERQERAHFVAQMAILFSWN